MPDLVTNQKSKIKDHQSSMSNHTSCRVCGDRLPSPFLDLGSMPLANSFLASPEEFSGEQTFPLALTSCGTCGLVQLTYVVPAETLYRDYIYVSSTSDAVREHGRTLAARFRERYGLTPSDLVVEIASNDGTVLKAFQGLGLKVLGVEPARNIAQIAVTAGVPTVPEFFTGDLGASLVAAPHQPAAVILARHVFAHVDDVHDFLAGAAALLDDRGVLAIEVPYLGDLLANGEFDTVYHEHLSYFALSQFVRLCERHDLRVVDVDRIELHGGSIIVHIRKPKWPVSDAVTRLLADEASSQMWSVEQLQRFGERVARWKREFESSVAGVKAKGNIIVGYGAAAKANTLLNYCPDVARSLVCILDRSPHKQGKYTPGTHTLVRPVEDWRSLGATHMAILAWNFRHEIMRQMQPFADAGGSFIVPLPKVEIIPA
jgi:novobiocin biosynthesis protein NovU/D-mycarose 3-C-methyltransferase